MLVRGSRASALSCAFPRELFRFQRRDSFRVRAGDAQRSPQARLRHTEIPDLDLALRVLDVSIGGCALFLPDDVPPLRPGALLPGVLIELDADTRFHVNLRLQHVTAINAASARRAAGLRRSCRPAATRSARCSATSTRRKSAAGCWRWIEGAPGSQSTIDADSRAFSPWIPAFAGMTKESAGLRLAPRPRVTPRYTCMFMMSE